jgi:hypothetical protein
MVASSRAIQATVEPTVCSSETNNGPAKCESRRDRQYKAAMTGEDLIGATGIGTDQHSE